MSTIIDIEAPFAGTFQESLHRTRKNCLAYVLLKDYIFVIFSTILFTVGFFTFDSLMDLNDILFYVGIFFMGILLVVFAVTKKPLIFIINCYFIGIYYGWFLEEFDFIGIDKISSVFLLTVIFALISMFFVAGGLSRWFNYFYTVICSGVIVVLLVPVALIFIDMIGIEIEIEFGFIIYGINILFIASVVTIVLMRYPIHNKKAKKYE